MSWKVTSNEAGVVASSSMETEVGALSITGASLTGYTVNQMVPVSDSVLPAFATV